MDHTRNRSTLSDIIAHWRLFNISLAGKCRLLFGVAVLLIIVVALSVPWFRMDRLVDEQNAQAARALAEAYLRYDVHRSLLKSPLPAGLDSRDKANAPSTSPASERQSGQPGGGWVGLSSSAVHEMLVPRTGLGASRPQLIMEDDPRGLDEFIDQSLKMFTADPMIGERFRLETTPQGRRVYRYVRAVRAERTCRECHSYGAVTVPSTSGNMVARDFVPGDVVGVIQLSLTAEQADRQALWNRASIVAAVALATMCAIVVFYLVTHHLILAPVHQLQEAAEQVTGGNLDTRAKIQTGDEFEEFATAFNQMLSSLQESNQQLKTINASLDTKLVELAQTNVTLFESNKLKTAFLANVSHELRTPLNSIIGFAELLQTSHISDEPKLSRYVDNIASSSRALLELINDLLDLARIEAGKVQLRIEKMNLGDIAVSLHNFIQPLADKGQLTFEVVQDDDLPLMRSDAGKIQQILYNLLSNAVKFTPPGGRVTLSLSRIGNDQVSIAVSDTGPGIAEDMQQEIFEKFRQADNSTSREHGGTGLGLAIAKELTELLGGTISVSSTEGQGATFTVVLPIDAPRDRSLPPTVLS